MKILFMGTPEFAVPCLAALIGAGHTVLGAVTQPDRPKGRGHKLQPPPVKVCAQEYGIPVFQPESLKDGALQDTLDALQPELIAVVAYGKILPPYILDYPKYGCINVHASLLPQYRGAGPIQWAVINGEAVTGVTTMYMAKGLDTGDMILKQATAIAPDETAGALHDRLAPMGAELLVKTVALLEVGTAPREAQDDAASSYAPMIAKETGRIDWSRPAQAVVNLVRGTNPWPMSHTVYCGAPMKIVRARLGGCCDKQPGEIVGLTADKELEVACGDGQSVVISEIQMQGGKQMRVRDYLNGHTLDLHAVLGRED